jgi:hypothetical protein
MPLEMLRFARVLFDAGRDLKVARLRLAAEGLPFPKMGCAVQHYG